MPSLSGLGYFLIFACKTGYEFTEIGQFFHLEQHFSLSALLTSWVRASVVDGPEHWRKLSSIPGLYALDAKSTSPFSPHDNQKSAQCLGLGGGKTSLSGLGYFWIFACKNWLWIYRDRPVLSSRAAFLIVSSIDIMGPCFCGRWPCTLKEA